jgi:hypothetical protein
MLVSIWFNVASHPCCCESSQILHHTLELQLKYSINSRAVCGDKETIDEHNAVTVLLCSGVPLSKAISIVLK